VHESALPVCELDDSLPLTQPHLAFRHAKAYGSLFIPAKDRLELQPNQETAG